MTAADGQRESPFWRFSLAFYRQPGVADACIALQDGYGVDVNVLLFLLWLGAEKRRIALHDAEAVCRKAHGWRDDVVAPLRAVRRTLKNGSALVEDGTAELFRTRIKATELEAERLEQEALFAISKGLATIEECAVEASAHANVAVYEQILGRTLASEPLAMLIRTLAKD